MLSQGTRAVVLDGTQIVCQRQTAYVADTLQAEQVRKLSWLDSIMRAIQGNIFYLSLAGQTQPDYEMQVFSD